MTDKQALNIDAIYTTKEINQAITLYEGKMCLKQSEKPDSEYVNGNGAITFNWLPKPRIEYKLSLESTNFSSHKVSKYSYLDLPNSTFKVFPAFLKDGDRPYCLGVLKHKNGIQESQKISYVKFHIANFHQYMESGIFNSLSSPQILSGRLRLTSCKWEVTIDSLSSQNEQYQELKMRGGYLITHVAKLEKVNRENFSTEEATEVLSALDYFLAFVRGLWAAPILPVGFDENNNCVWQLWEAPKVSSRQAVNSWFPTNKPHSVTHAFKGFMKLWNDPAQKNHLKLVIHWYVESNLQSGGIEGSILMAHSAFELIYNSGLVKIAKDLSSKDIKKKGAEEKMVEILKYFNLPSSYTEIPDDSEPKTIKSAAKNFKEIKGRGLIEDIVFIRNRIMHPKMHEDSQHILDSLELRKETLKTYLWYLELVLLSLFGYKEGFYNDRFNTHSHLGCHDYFPPIFKTQEPAKDNL